MDGGDIRMVERRQYLRFPLQAPEATRIVEKTIVQNLDGDVPIELRIPCPIHRSHPAGANGGNDLIRAQPSTGGKRHR